MTLLHAYLIPGLWTTWAVVWWLWSRQVKATRRRESATSRAAHLVPLIIAVALLASPRLPGDFLGGRFLPATSTVYWIGVATLALGLAFAIWARAYIGRNWSAAVTLKEEHELVRTGPYSLVRHPIYTGLLLGLLGSAIAHGEWRGPVALAIALAALWRKLRLEERWMEETFGTQYAKYRAEVAALIPFVL
jgi:protein-S-isoprenylcysteine O-methyltransferase Ste14